MAGADGIELRGPIEGRFARDPDARRARVRGRAPAGARGDAGRAPPAPGRASGGVRRRRPAGLPARDPRDPRGRLDGRPGPEGSRAPVGRAHGPRRAEDGHQRAQLRRGRLHGGLRGREHADLAQHGPGPGQPPRRGLPDDRAPEPGRPDLSPARGRRDAARPAARLAPPPSGTAGGRGRRVGEPVRLRALRLPQRPPAPRARERALLLPPEARGPPRGAALERRVRPGRGPARSPARRDPRHRPRRDPPGRVRDGRDPVGAARPLGRAQRRPLGLHVQPHQEAPGPARVRPAGPGAGHDDGAVHAGLHRAPREDLSPPRRARARRNGGLHPQPARSAGQRGGPGPGAGGQDPRVPGRLRRDVGGPPGPRRGRPRAVRAAPRGPPASARAAAPRGGRRRAGAARRPRARAGR